MVCSMEPCKMKLIVILAVIIYSYGALAIRPIAQVSATRSYVVVFDAGSSGSRVHVYQFGLCNGQLELVPMGANEIEFFEAIKPGLSSYASDPKAAAMSLKPLLEDALTVIPVNDLSSTPLRLGATAGLRQLPGDQADRILEEVEALLSQSGLLLAPGSVIVMDGKDEGAFLWICVNFLSGNIGKPFAKTFAAVDLGGGSVQMVYAISEKQAQKAPAGDTYLRTVNSGGQKYYLYVHSYLNYGLLAARAKVLNLTTGGTNPCIATGYTGEYVYGGVTYPAVSPETGASFTKCRRLVLEALNVKKYCPYHKCAFDGIWSGEGGPGEREVYLTSFFYDRASELGILKNGSSPGEYLKPADFKRAARKVCSMSAEEVKQIHMDGLMCLDMVYESTLLISGFGIDSDRKVKVINRIPYKGFEVDNSWTLGSAIEAVSSSLPSTTS